jgi:hypothetical protein
MKRDAETIMMHAQIRITIGYHMRRMSERKLHGLVPDIRARPSFVDTVGTPIIESDVGYQVYIGNNRQHIFHVTR